MAKGARDYMVKLNGTKYLVDARAYGEGPVQALALKTSEGDPKYGDMSHLSNYVQSDWRGGRAEDRAESGNRFYDSSRVITWLHGQAVLSPRVTRGLLSAQGVNQPGIVDYAVAETMAAAADTPNNIYSKLAQSFQVSATTITTVVYLFLNTSHNALLPDTSASLTLRIETDSSGSPSGTLIHADATSSATVSLTPISQWYRFSLGPVDLTLNTTYWLVLSGSGTDSNIQWAMSPDSVYANGQAKRYDDSAWLALTRDRFFVVLTAANSLSQSGNWRGIVFNNIFYVAAGLALYKLTAGVWVGVKTDFANVITDLDVLDNVLWIATGTGNVSWTMTTGESFTSQTGIFAQLFHTFDGYLYRANANDLYYYDGATWSAALEVGDDTQNITGLTGLNKSLLIARPDGLWGYTSGPWVYNIIRWESQADANNGKEMCEWNGAVYIPVKYGLVKYDGNSFVNVGPDQDEGLPNDRLGKIVSILPLLNYLVVATDGTNLTSAGVVLLYNGRGWHEIDRVWAKIIGGMVAYDWYTSPNRLYFQEGTTSTTYVELSDKADNPDSWLPSTFAGSGYLETSWISGGLLGVWKELSEIWINLDIVGSDAFFDGSANEQMRVSMDYQCDRSGIWIHRADATITAEARRVGGRTIDLKKKSTITATTVSSIAADGVVTVAAIGTIAKGQWVKIGNETRQVKSISGNTFTPTSYYDYAATADTVEGGYPTFREVKFRLRLYTKVAASSPAIKAIRVSYATQLTAWWRWSLRIKVGDRMLLPDNTRDTRTAATLRTGLKELATEGNSLVDFVDIYDASYKTQLVKMEMQPASYKEDGSVDVESVALVELVEI